MCPQLDEDLKGKAQFVLELHFFLPLFFFYSNVTCVDLLNSYLTKITFSDNSNSRHADSFDFMYHFLR